MRRTLIKVRSNDRPSDALTTDIHIGRQGEGGVLAVVFDVTDFIADYGDGTASIVQQRFPGEQPMICSGVFRSGATVTWIVSNLNTAIAGEGIVELNWAVDGGLAKSVAYRTMVEESTARFAVPSPETETWLGKMLAESNAIKSALQTIKTTSMDWSDENVLAVMDGRLGDLIRKQDLQFQHFIQAAARAYVDEVEVVKPYLAASSPSNLTSDLLTDGKEIHPALTDYPFYDVEYHFFGRRGVETFRLPEGGGTEMIITPNSISMDGRYIYIGEIRLLLGHHNIDDPIQNCTTVQVDSVSLIRLDTQNNLAVLKTQYGTADEIEHRYLSRQSDFYIDRITARRTRENPEIAAARYSAHDNTCYSTIGQRLDSIEGVKR